MLLVALHAAQTSTITIYEQCNYAGRAGLAQVGNYPQLGSLVRLWFTEQHAVSAAVPYCYDSLAKDGSGAANGTVAAYGVQHHCKSSKLMLLAVV
jgi:hypothetical protein